MDSINTMTEAIAYLRRNARGKETKYIREVRYGHLYTTIKYFSKKNGLLLGSVSKTDGEVGQVKIEIDESNEYIFTSYGKQKVRPLQV